MPPSPLSTQAAIWSTPEPGPPTQPKRAPEPPTSATNRGYGAPVGEAIAGPLHHRVPGFRQAHRAVDHADHRVGLRKVAPELPGADVKVLGEKPDGIAAGEQRL